MRAHEKGDYDLNLDSLIISSQSFVWYLLPAYESSIIILRHWKKIYANLPPSQICRSSSEIGQFFSNTDQLPKIHLLVVII